MPRTTMVLRPRSLHIGRYAGLPFIIARPRRYEKWEEIRSEESLGSGSQGFRYAGGSTSIRRGILSW